MQDFLNLHDDNLHGDLLFHTSGDDLEQFSRSQESEESSESSFIQFWMWVALLLYKIIFDLCSQVKT